MKKLNWIAIAWVTFGTCGAQTFVYTNDTVGANAVTGFAIDGGGKGTIVPGSPFATKGNAGGISLSNNQNFAANRIITTTAGNRLFVTNDSDGSVSAFNINTGSGALTLVSGSPFPAVGACNAGMSLAISPNGKTLVAGSMCTPNLVVFSVDSSGSLAQQGSGKLAGCKASNGVSASLKFTPDGKNLAVANPACTSVEMFLLSGSGSLQIAPNSPYPLRAGSKPNNALDIGCTNNTLITAGPNPGGPGISTMNVFAVSSDNSLAEIPGSPYQSSKNADFESATFTADDQYVAISGWNFSAFSVFSMGSGGTMREVTGSPFFLNQFSPAQIVAGATGPFLFVAEDTGDPGFTPGLITLTLGGNPFVSPVNGAPFLNPKGNRLGGYESLAAFPPKTCASATGPALTVAPSAPVFTSVVGSQSTPQQLTLTNSGGVALNITNIKVNGDSTGFSLDLTNCLGVTLQPGNSCNMNVSYIAASATQVQFPLVISTNPAATVTPVTLTGKGTSAAAATIAVSPSLVTFKDTVAGTISEAGLVSVGNTGSAPLTITSIQADDPNFYLDPTACTRAPIQPGNLCFLGVQFRPVKGGNPLTANITFTSNATNTAALKLTGVSYGPKQCPDADGDGLCDIWETDGVHVLAGGIDTFIDLPKMGANPKHKDVFVHADWMTATGDGAHNHQPKKWGMELAAAAFNAAPDQNNPDGQPGISLHIDCGPDCIMDPRRGVTWGDLSMAASIPEVNPFTPTDMQANPNALYDWTNFDNASGPFNATGRKMIFHHVIFVHDQARNTSSSGVSRNFSDSLSSFFKGSTDFIVSLGSWGDLDTDTAEGGTLMHELGHNLGLAHGGLDGYNYKPNYLGVMNYNFQTNGLIVGGKQGQIDYSRFELPDLDEYNLNEEVGLNARDIIPTFGTAWYCPFDDPAKVAPQTTPGANGWIDWNCDKKAQKKTATDINGETDAKGNPVGHVLVSQNDWKHLTLKGGSIGGQVDTPPKLTSLHQGGSELNAEEAVLKVAFNRVQVAAPSLITLAPGASATVAMVVRNKGSLADTYALAAPAVAGWLATANLPATLSLDTGASSNLQLTVSAPSTAKPGDSKVVQVTVKSQNSPASSSAQMVISVTATPTALAFSSMSVNLGIVTLGASSSQFPVTVTNTGGSAVNIASLAAAGDFAQTNTCGTSLAAGASCVIQVSFKPTAAGARTGTINIADSATGGPHVIALKGTALPPAPQIGAVANAASNATDGFAPGTLVTIYGLNLADAPSFVSGLPLPSPLGGSTVSINGLTAPFFYAGPGQVNVQLPYELTPGDNALTLVTSAGLSTTVNVPVVDVSPGVFMIAGTQHAAAQNPDYSTNLASQPVAPGGYVQMYLTGQGLLDHTVKTGDASPSAPLALIPGPVTATIAGLPATVLFAGMTPGAVGLAQANVAVPATGPGGQPWAAGDYPVVISIGGVAANPANISIAAGK